MNYNTNIILQTSESEQIKSDQIKPDQITRILELGALAWNFYQNTIEYPEPKSNLI